MPRIAASAERTHARRLDDSTDTRDRCCRCICGALDRGARGDGSDKAELVVIAPGSLERAPLLATEMPSKRGGGGQLIDRDVRANAARMCDVAEVGKQSVGHVDRGMCNVGERNT